MSKEKELSTKQFPPEIWQTASEIDQLPDKKRKKEIAQWIMVARQSPYPPPAEVETYQKYCPDFMDRVLTMTEKTLEHSIEIEKGLVTANTELAKSGMQRGSLIAIVSLIIMGVAIVYNSYWLGAAAFVSGMATIIGAFVTKQVKR